MYRTRGTKDKDMKFTFDHADKYDQFLGVVEQFDQGIAGEMWRARRRVWYKQIM